MMPSAKSVVILSGSPSSTSKTAMVGDFVAEWCGRQGLAANHIRIRELSPVSLLTGDVGDEQLSAAMEAVANADGIVLATPTFKASFSGLLKAFLDVLPQFGLREKVIMPLATGGSLAHVLALDYGLRPVVQSMRPSVIVPSVFLLDKDMLVEGGRLAIDDRSGSYLLEILEEFAQALRMIPGSPRQAAEPATHQAIRQLAEAIK